MAYTKAEGKPDAPFKKRPIHKKRKVCTFCGQAGEAGIDYKNVALLKKYISERGKILPRRMTGVCAMHQRELTTAIKRARHIALLPFMEE